MAWHCQNFQGLPMANEDALTGAHPPVRTRHFKQ